MKKRCNNRKDEKEIAINKSSTTPTPNAKEAIKVKYREINTFLYCQKYSFFRIFSIEYDFQMNILAITINYHDPMMQTSLASIGYLCFLHVNYKHFLNFLKCQNQENGNSYLQFHYRKINFFLEFFHLAFNICDKIYLKMVISSMLDQYSQNDLVTVFIFYSLLTEITESKYKKNLEKTLHDIEAQNIA